MGGSCRAWAWGPPGDACIANSPSGFCKGAAFFGFVTTPPPQFANCKLRQSQLQLAKEKRSRQGTKTNSNREGLGKMGRIGNARPGLAPHFWIPGLLTPPPGRPWLCNCKGGRKGELSRRPGGRAPPPRSYCSGAERGWATRALPPPRNSARRVGTGPRPLLKLGFCVLGGSWDWGHAPFSPPPANSENPG